MENTLNIKCNWRHSTLEYLIKKADSSQDMSRSAVFAREVRAAESVTDWKAVQILLADLEKEDEAPEFTNFQAKYDDEISEILEKVKAEMFASLKDAGTITKVLQTQFMVQLLQVNYLEVLKEEKLALKENDMVDESDVNLPEMAKILVEMMLKDKDCDELKKIRRILIDWRNAL